MRSWSLCCRRHSQGGCVASHFSFHFDSIKCVSVWIKLDWASAVANDDVLTNCYYYRIEKTQSQLCDIHFVWQSILSNRILIFIAHSALCVRVAAMNGRSGRLSWVSSAFLFLLLSFARLLIQFYCKFHAKKCAGIFPYSFTRFGRDFCVIRSKNKKKCEWTIKTHVVFADVSYIARLFCMCLFGGWHVWHAINCFVHTQQWKLVIDIPLATPFQRVLQRPATRSQETTIKLSNIADAHGNLQFMIGIFFPFFFRRPICLHFFSLFLQRLQVRFQFRKKKSNNTIVV